MLSNDKPLSDPCPYRAVEHVRPSWLDYLADGFERWRLSALEREAAQLKNAIEQKERFEDEELPF